jgi:hypothetical protein
MIFGKKIIEHKIVFRVSTQLSSETFLIITRIQQDIITNVQRSSCKVPANSSDFNKT